MRALALGVLLIAVLLVTAPRPVTWHCMFRSCWCVSQLCVITKPYWEISWNEYIDVGSH